MEETPSSNSGTPQQPTNLRFIQYNCNKSSNVVATLLEIASRTADIILIQEPWIHKDGRTITHPHMTAITPTSTSQRPRVMTYINKTTLHLTITPRPDIAN